MVAAGLKDPRIDWIGDEKARPVGPVFADERHIVARAALPVTLEQRRHHLHRIARGCRPLKAEPHKVHADQRGGRAARIERCVDGFIADRYTCFVDPLLGTPTPTRPTDDAADGGFGRAFDGDVSGLSEGFGTRHRPLDDLRLLRRTIAVLGEQGDAVGRSRGKGDERVTHD